MSGHDPIADISRIGHFERMDTAPSSASPSSWSSRFKSATLGICVTLAPLLAIACTQLVLSPSIVERAGFDPPSDSWAVFQYRQVLLSSYAWIAAIVVAYWMAALTLGRGEILLIKNANLTLAGAVFTFASAMIAASLVPQTSELFKWACPILGLSDTYTRFGFDIPTRCESFTSKTTPTVLLGLPLLLLAVSALLRVVGSRRQCRSCVR